MAAVDSAADVKATIASPLSRLGSVCSRRGKGHKSAKEDAERSPHKGAEAGILRRLRRRGSSG